MAQETERDGRFGVHGGQYIPETLMNAVIELEEAYKRYKDDPKFNAELTELLNEYAGRPSRLYYAKHMTEDLGGAKIYLKREDLNHTGAHKINNALGQALLAKYMGKKRLIAETGAGQHGVATATVAALLNMECVVYMGEEDTVRQALNVYRMRLLGAEVVAVKTGTRTLKDAVSEAMREWTARIEDTHYCIGSCMGPHPFPTMVRYFKERHIPIARIYGSGEELVRIVRECGVPRGILRYIEGREPHYIAFVLVDAEAPARYRFFNAADGKEDFIETMEYFRREHLGGRRVVRLLLPGEEREDARARGKNHIVDAKWSEHLPRRCVQYPVLRRKNSFEPLSGIGRGA